MSFPDKYHPRVKQILEKNVIKRYKKKECKVCKGQRYTGIDEDNKLISCPRCINIVEAKEDYSILENEIAINQV